MQGFAKKYVFTNIHALAACSTDELTHFSVARVKQAHTHTHTTHTYTLPSSAGISACMLHGNVSPNDSVMTATYVLTIVDLFPGF